MAIDPVCKMEVEESKAAATSEYKGKSGVHPNRQNEGHPNKWRCSKGATHSSSNSNISSWEGPITLFASSWR